MRASRIGVLMLFIVGVLLCVDGAEFFAIFVANERNIGGLGGTWTVVSS